MVDLFNGKGSSDSSSSTFADSSHILSPARLCYIIKQALREGAIGNLLFPMSYFSAFVIISASAKLVILCDLFSRRKGDLSREERHEIIKYAKSRFKQNHLLLEVALNIFAPGSLSS
jgi:hypothetical protein